MNQDSHVTQRLTEAQEKPIHRARHNMVWHLEWHGEGVFLDGAPIPVYRIGQFATMRAAHEYVTELASRFNQASYTLTRI